MIDKALKIIENSVGSATRAVNSAEVAEWVEDRRAEEELEQQLRLQAGAKRP